MNGSPALWQAENLYGRREQEALVEIAA